MRGEATREVGAIHIPVDEQGRHVWVVTWGRPGRRDWKAVLVVAFDGDEARATAHEAHPGLLPPDAAELAADATAQAVLNDEPVANLPVIR